MDNLHYAQVLINAHFLDFEIFKDCSHKTTDILIFLCQLFADMYDTSSLRIHKSQICNKFPNDNSNFFIVYLDEISLVILIYDLHSMVSFL